MNSNFVYTNEPLEEKNSCESTGGSNNSLDKDSSLNSFESTCISLYPQRCAKSGDKVHVKDETEYDASAEDESDEAVSKQSSSEDELTIQCLSKAFVLPLSSVSNSSADEDNPAQFESEVSV